MVVKCRCGHEADGLLAYEDHARTHEISGLRRFGLTLDDRNVVIPLSPFVRRALANELPGKVVGR